MAYFNAQWENALIDELCSLGYTDSKFVTLEEQLAIFLYCSVTGLQLDTLESDSKGPMTLLHCEYCKLLNTNYF